MSDYGYDDPPRRHRSSRVRDREPEYVTETTYIQRGPGQPSRELVFRGREDSIEDIERDFPPPGSRRGGYRDDYGPRRARSVGGRRHDYDDDYDDFAPAAAGAAAGYAAAKAQRRGSRYDDGYYSDDYDRPPRRERRKSKIQETLDGFGLGGIAGALTGNRSRSRGRDDRDDRYDSDSDRSTRSRRGGRGKGENQKKWQQAATAALIAGATEAYRSRKDPNKGTRIATAALASAGLDSFLDREPGHHSKRHVIESVVGGLAANRLANGRTDRSQSRGRSESRSQSRGPGGGFRSRSRSILRSLSRGGRGRDASRSRSRSRGRGLKEVAALGGVAAVGKAIYDRVRSKSRGRNRSRSRSESEDSYVPSRRQQYRGGQGGRQQDDDGYNDRSGPADREHPDDVRGDINSTDDPVRGRALVGQIEEGKRRDASSSSISTTDLENQRKKSRGKELLTAGLATVATIHAAHGVYSSMKASEERHKAVAAGEMSKEQARKQKSKNMLQDAAAVGIAALGIKGAFSEWKEMNEQRHEVKEIEEKHRKKRKRRDQRRREAREQARQQRMMYGPMGYSPYGYPPVQAPPMPVYADANPYAVGNLPPPPMGGGGGGSGGSSARY